MSCTALKTKAYTQRPSPPYKAGDCPNQTRKGNDGLMYESRPARNGAYRWFKTAAARKSKIAAKNTGTSGSLAKHMANKQMMRVAQLHFPVGVVPLDLDDIQNNVMQSRYPFNFSKTLLKLIPASMTEAETLLLDAYRQRNNADRRPPSEREIFQYGFQIAFSRMIEQDATYKVGDMVYYPFFYRD
eukprot:1624504-Pyramimonas_sp.AAC.1